MPGQIAPLEEHLARLDAGYTLPAWEGLSATQRATEVALARIRERVKLYENDALQAKAKRQRKRK